MRFLTFSYTVFLQSVNLTQKWFNKKIMSQSGEPCMCLFVHGFRSARSATREFFVAEFDRPHKPWLFSRVSNRTWTRTVNPNEPFHFGEPEPNLNQQNFTSVNLNQTWTSKMVLKWTRTKPEPLKYFEQELNLNPNRYLKRFDTLLFRPAKNAKFCADQRLT